MKHKHFASILSFSLLPLFGACDPGGAPTDSVHTQFRDGGVPSGMTWQLNGSNVELDLIRVGCSGCDPYAGDTLCDETRPVLCINDTDNTPNPGVETDFYNGWTHGQLFATEPVVGLALTSIEVANELCEAQFGDGFRMAEHHDGGGGWNYWSYGSLPNGTRMWTYIDDQDANCWNADVPPCNDNDNDGVCDDADECLATLPGAVVDGMGCEGVLVCKDATVSPSCTCEGPWGGCCSWHGGVAGCG